MNRKPVLRALFRVAIATPVWALFLYAGSLILGFNFDYAIFIGGLLGIAFSSPKSNLVWKLILSEYGLNTSAPNTNSKASNTQVPRKQLLASGVLYDKQEEKEEGIIIFTSITKNGLILYGPHVIPALREIALIPWKDVTVQRISERTPAPEGKLVDQVAPWLADIKIRGVVPILEIPWSKELELYTNIILNQNKDEPTNSVNLSVMT
ncbi:MAG: hypothetical protein R3E73_10090 [Porticoccaceae bacterium]|nr:hypothetical protein [Pseudomonadales bacterium]MCP5171005.1 hypothetical protein [Pseudomonadales bacterium]MCP5301757.1 hypothetical protein [Pseudomonadales bacterium]